MTERPPIRLVALDPDDTIESIDGAPPVRDDEDAIGDDPLKIVPDTSLRATRRGLVKALGQSGLGPRKRKVIPKQPTIDAREIAAKLDAIENRGDLDPAQLRLRTDLACLRTIPQTPHPEYIGFDEDAPPTEHENLLTLRNILALNLYGMQMEDPAEARRQNIGITTEGQTLRSFKTYIEALKESRSVDEKTLVREIRSLFDILEDLENIRRIKISDASIRRAYLMSPEIAMTGLKEATFYGRKLLSTYREKTAGSEGLLGTYTELAKIFLQSEHISDITILFKILLELKDRFGRRLTIIGETIKAMLSLIPEGKMKRILLGIVNETASPNTHVQTVNQTLKFVKDKLEEGVSVQSLLDILKNNKSPHYIVAYWIVLNLFEEANDEFLTTQTADSLKRKGRRILRENSTEEAVLQYVLGKGEREIAEAVSQKIQNSAISEQNLSDTVEEIVLAQTLADEASVTISAEIESADEEFDANQRKSLADLAKRREFEKRNRVTDKSVGRALTAVLVELGIRRLEYELEECPLTDEEKAHVSEKLAELRQGHATDTEEEINFGMRIIKHTIIRTYEKSAEIRGGTVAQEIGTVKEIETAIKLLRDKGRDGKKFTRNTMSRRGKDALYILQQTGPHMRRCAPLPFDLYKIRAEADDDTTYRNLLRERYEFIFNVADIDLFDPPLQQHIPCLVKVVIEHLSRYGKNIFDNSTRT